jgi:hypothetical protein
MTSAQEPPRSIAAILGTAWTRLLAVLAGVALLLGIVAEVISIITGYYNMQRAASDAVTAAANAKAATTATVVLPHLSGDNTESVHNRIEWLRAERKRRGLDP